jgi:zinc transport system permease protein
MSMANPALIASTGGAGNTNLDAFDALLAPTPPSAAAQSVASATDANGAAPGAAASSQTAAPPRAEIAHAPPRFQEFVSGWSLYQDPILCAVIAGAALGALGVFVVLRRAVFVTATLSQAAGLGVALAFYLQIHHGIDLSPVAGALIMSAAATLLVGARPPGKMSRETLVGMAFVTTSALAVLVGDRIAQEAHDIAAVLFGTAVLVRPIDLQLVIGGGLLTVGALYAIARPLTFSGFDPEGARIQGLPVRAIEVSFWLIFAVVVSVSTRALGSLPVFALAVLPAAAGLGVGERLGVAVALAALGGALSGGLGYLAAFMIELPVGASQSACAAVLAVLAYALVRLIRRPSAAAS